MNNTSSVAVSLLLLNQQFVSSVLWAFFSPLVIISHSVVIFTICITKSLHNKSFFAIASHSVAEAVYGIIYLILGTKRSLYFILGIPATTTQILCLLEQLPPFTASNVVKTLNFALAMDRFLYINAPLFYCSRGTLTYIGKMNAVCWGYSLIKVPFTFVNVSKNKTAPFCSPNVPFQLPFLKYWLIEGNVLNAGTIVLYTVTACVLLYRYKTTAFFGETEKSAWRRKMDLDVFKSMTVIGVSFIVSYGFAQSVTSLVVQFGSFELQLNIVLMNQVMLTISAAAQLFLYVLLNYAFRDALLRIIRGNSTTVLVSLRT